MAPHVLQLFTVAAFAIAVPQLARGERCPHWSRHQIGDGPDERAAEESGHADCGSRPATIYGPKAASSVKMQAVLATPTK